MMLSRASQTGINRALGNFYIDINLLKVVLGNSVSLSIQPPHNRVLCIACTVLLPQP